MKTTSKVRVGIRICKCRGLLVVGSERIRRQLFAELEEIFHIASDYGRGNVSRVTDEDGKKRPLTIAERRSWVRVAALTALIMANVTKGIDECQIDVDLNKLEAMLEKAPIVASIQTKVE
jgi:hypothetical protein